jgi:hypothetical protein
MKMDVVQCVYIHNINSEFKCSVPFNLKKDTETKRQALNKVFEAKEFNLFLKGILYV